MSDDRVVRSARELAAGEALFHAGVGPAPPAPPAPLAASPPGMLGLLGGFAPKAWQDLPSTATPISAAALVDLEGRLAARADAAAADVEAQVAVVKEAPINAKAPPGGGSPVAWDGATDDTAALQALVALLPQTGSQSQKGGEILLPRGRGIAHGLNLDGLVNVVLRGHGGGQGATELFSNSTGATALISAKSSYGLRVEGIALTNSQAAFTGKMIDLDGTSPSPTIMPVLRDMRVTMLTQAGSSALGVAWEYVLGSTISASYFSGGKAHIRGRTSGAGFSNANTIDERCWFDQADTIPILNPYQWIIDGAVFEPLRSGNAGAILSEAGIPAFILAVRDCWTGDVANDLGVWYHVHGTALRFAGGIVESGLEGIRLRSGEATKGLGVRDVYFNDLTNGINFNSLSVDGADIGPNVWGTVTNKHANASFFGSPSRVDDVEGTVGRQPGSASNWQLNKSLLLNDDALASVYFGVNLDARLFRSAAAVLGTDSDLAFTTLGRGIKVAEGANAKMGRATLVAGTVTVNTTKVTANSEIFLTCQVPGGTPGFLRVSARTAGTSFTILSGSGTDTSVVGWVILEPA